MRAPSTDDDTPITLAAAVKLWPQAKLTVSTLRAEAARGRLDIFRIGRRDYTTAQAMRDMVDRCRAEDYRRDYISIQRTWVIRDGSRFIRLTASETERAAAERQLAEYLGRKWQPKPSGAPLIADVLTVYATEVAPHRKRSAILRLSRFASLGWMGRRAVRTYRPKHVVLMPKPPGARHRVGIHGRQTSLSLEPPFWYLLRRICAECGTTVTKLIEAIDIARDRERSLCSEIRADRLP